MCQEHLPFQIRPGFIATDMDGTLTQQGKFTASLLASLQNLAQAGWSVLIVTGRSAGWVSGLSYYLPIVGAIAENGGIFYDQAGISWPLTPLPDWREHRHNLSQVFQSLQGEFPQIRESADNLFRLTDWTFDNPQFSVAQLTAMADFCHTLGWGFTYSSVQCHIKPQPQDKATGLLQVLQTHFPSYSPQEVMTVGDSPNDASLFNPDFFPCSVGVANVREYLDQLPYAPCYMTTGDEGAGFCELAQFLLERGKESSMIDLG